MKALNHFKKAVGGRYLEGADVNDQLFNGLEMVAEFDNVFVVMMEDEDYGHLTTVWVKWESDFAPVPEFMGDIDGARKAFAHLCIKHADF